MLDEIEPAQYVEWIAALNIGLEQERWLQAGLVADSVQSSTGASLQSPDAFLDMLNRRYG